MEASKITKEEMSRNPQAVLDVLEFYTENMGSISKSSPQSKSALSRSDSEPSDLNSSNQRGYDYPQNPTNTMVRPPDRSSSMMDLNSIGKALPSTSHPSSNVAASSSSNRPVANTPATLRQSDKLQVVIYTIFICNLNLLIDYLLAIVSSDS